MIRNVALSMLVAGTPFIAMLTPTDIDDDVVRQSYQFTNGTKRQLTPTGEYYNARLFADTVALQEVTDPNLLMLLYWTLSEYRRFIEQETLQ